MPTDAVRLGANWWRIARDRDGTPLYKQEPVPFFPPQVAQEELTEALFPPESRQPYSFRDLSGGSGQSEIPLGGANTRYDRIGDAEGEGVDTTLTPAGPVILAAELNTQAQAPAATSNFVGALWKGGTNTAYFAMGRYVYSWTGIAFANVGDLGAGNAASDALLPFRGKSASDTWYAPLGAATTARYSTDSGATWTAINTGGGVNQLISAVVVDGEVVYAAASPRQGSALVASFDDGGTTPTQYGVIDPVGDPAYAISRLVVVHNRVLVIKDGEGLFMLTETRRTLDEELFPELHGAKLYAAGAAVWRGVLWLPTDRGLFAVIPHPYRPGYILQAVGPEQYEARTTSGARGVVTAVVGSAHHLYGFRYGGSSTANSWLLKAKVRVVAGSIDSIVWHDFLQLAAGAQSSAMAMLAPNSNGPKLLVDRQTAAGAFTTYWLRLPAQGSDPRSDSAYRYAAAGTLYYSRMTARFPAVNKTFFGITPLCAPLNLAVDGQTATTAQSLRTRYKLDSTALTGTSPFGYTQGTVQTSGSGTRDNFAVRGRGLDAAIRLASTDNTTTPQVNAVTPEYDVEPSAVWRHVMTLDISEGGVTDAGNTGAGDPATPSKAISLLRTLPGGGTLTLTDLWENSYSVTIPLTGIAPRAGAPREESNAKEIPLLVDVVANEQTALAIGTYARLTLTTYGLLKATGLPYSALASY